jgi:hypothetical protein
MPRSTLLIEKDHERDQEDKIQANIIKANICAG